MLRFIQFLEEKVLNPGFNSEHEHYREKYRDQIHDIIRKSYTKVDGGYGGLGSGTKKESESIHDDISKHPMKITRRGDKITSVAIYKKQHGRKSIASATNGTSRGKNDLIKTMEEDHEHKRAWGEASGAVAAIKEKLGHPKIPASEAPRLTGKSDIQPKDEYTYTRSIGGERHEKKLYGHPKNN